MSTLEHDTKGGKGKICSNKKRRSKKSPQKESPADLLKKRTTFFAGEGAKRSAPTDSEEKTEL